MDRNDLTAAAIDDFTAALKSAPGLAKAQFDRGVLYLETGELELAIADFNGAMRLGLSSRDLSFYRGMAQLQRGRFPPAVADFTEAIRVDPALAAAFLNRGVAYYRQDLLTEALADYEKAIALDPRMARAYLNRGVVRMTLGNLDGAIADFDVTLQQSRRAGDFSCVFPAYFDRGKAFFLKKDYPRAIDDWERVARDLVDRDSMTLDYLGLAYSRLQNEAKAARYFEDAVRLDDKRTYAPAHAHLGAVRYNQKDFDGAVKECTAAIEIDKTLAEAYSTRSLAFQALKRPEQWRADAEQAHRLRERPQDGRRPTASRLR
jgi:tetratricopeptide (TPR) repeat protein